MKEKVICPIQQQSSSIILSLCLSAPPSVVTFRTLVVIWHAATADMQTFQKIKIGANFCRCEIDANLIRVAHESVDIGKHSIRSDKRVYEKRMFGIGVP
jgi:hypothetical protein